MFRNLSLFFPGSLSSRGGRLRKRPSVSLEHQHSTPVASHCAAHYSDPGEFSHRGHLLFYFFPFLSRAHATPSECLRKRTSVSLEHQHSARTSHSAHGRPTPSECLRKRPSVSVSYLTGHSSSLSFLWSISTPCARRTPLMAARHLQSVCESV